jgi:DNA polymerase III subunit delta'
MELHFDVVGAAGPRRYFGSLTRETLAHAYLFSGAPGVGKKTFARRFAQSLLCTAPKDGVLGYDGTCQSCMLFAAESARHPDFLEHVGTLKIGDRDGSSGFFESDELTSRDLVRLLSLQSYVGGARVLLLGDVEFATREAANALLKFLEEPPGGVIVLLTSPAPERLLLTIRSRAIEIRFPLLAQAQVAEVLCKIGYDEREAEFGASLSGGSVTRALAILQPEEESLRAQIVRWFFESVGGTQPEEVWATRETLDEGLETIKTLVRDWIIVGTGGVALISLDQAEGLRALHPLTGRTAAALLAKLNDAQRLAQTNVSPTLVADLARMALATNTP